MISIIILVGTALAGDYGAGDMPCAETVQPTLSADMSKVRWPFREVVSKIVLKDKQMALRHAEECTRLLTSAMGGELAFDAGKIALDQGLPVSMDVPHGTLMTGEAAVLQASNGSWGGGYSYGYVAQDANVLRNLAFVNSHQFASGFAAEKASAATSEAAEKARVAKAEADAKAEKEKKLELDREAKRRAAAKAQSGL